MTPEETVNKLIDKFTCYRWVTQNGSTYSEKDFDTMKIWALIAVDEIILELNNERSINEDESHRLDRIYYWQQVKQIIKNRYVK